MADGGAAEADGGSDDFDRALRVVVLAAGVLVAVAWVVVLGSAYVPGAPGPCADASTPRTPTAAFDVGTDGQGNLVVAHRGGHTFTRRETETLMLVVEDGEMGERRRINWRGADARVNRESANETYPVGPGDRVTVESKLLGFEVDEGDAVTVVWRGYEPELPTYCPNRDDDRGPLLEAVLFDGRVDGTATARIPRR